MPAQVPKVKRLDLCFELFGRGKSERKAAEEMNLVSRSGMRLACEYGRGGRCLKSERDDFNSRDGDGDGDGAELRL